MKERIGEYEIEVVDERNYGLNKISIGEKGNNKGKEVATNIGYYNSLASAVKEIARRSADKVKGGLKEWLDEYKAVIEKVDNLLADA